MSDINIILKTRGRIYGDFRDVARKSQALKALLSRPATPLRYTPEQSEALDMLCNKLARIACGNPDHPDSWLDIAGYATLVANSLAPKTSPSADLQD